jgi:spore coat polysaccharide biosynthesis predicted glycosyltransferase SpsG
MIVFRSDFSSQTGLQAVQRCAYLASLLKKSNEVLLCCREDKQAAKFLAGMKVPFSLVKDAGAIDISKAKAVIFDLASFPSQDIALLEKAKKAGVKTIQVVLAQGGHQPVDIILSPFIEPGNALLHHKFRHFHKAKRKYRKNIKNIFINLGNLLPYRDLRRIVDTLHRLRFKMKIAPVLNLKKADKRNLMKIYPGIHFCGKSESAARAYFEADLALIPAGEEILEAAAVGTPALYFCQEPGQETMASAWDEHQAGLKFGKLEDMTLDSFREFIAPLTLERRQTMGTAAKNLVDGLGGQRFLKILKENGIIV